MPDPRRAEARVRKLLNLARDQAGTPEGESAARLARALMRDQARARLGPDDPADPHQRLRLDLGAPAPWRRRLASAVAAHCACVAAWPPGGSAVVLFGRGSALAVAEYLLAVTLREVEAARARVEGAGAGPTELNAFCHSAVTAVEARLRALREGEREDDPSGAALVRQEDRGVRAWMAEQGLRPSPAPPWVASHSPAGWAAGRAIPLHDAVRGAGPRGALPRSG
jgi:hypothetical protein